MKCLLTRTRLSLAASLLLHVGAVGVIWAAVQAIEDQLEVNVRSGQTVTVVLTMAAAEPTPTEAPPVEIKMVELTTEAPAAQIEVKIEDHPLAQPAETDLVVERGTLPPPKAAVEISPEKESKVSATQPPQKIETPPLPRPPTPTLVKPSPTRRPQAPTPVATKSNVTVQFQSQANAGARVDHHPSELYNIEPEYPAESIAARQQGSVEILVLVGVDGSVKDARIYKSSGYALLDAAGLKAAWRWKFSPARSGGVAVEAYLRKPFNFGILKR